MGRATEDLDMTEKIIEKTIAGGRHRVGALTMSVPMDGNPEAALSLGLCGTVRRI